MHGPYQTLTDLYRAFWNLMTIVMMTCLRFANSTAFLWLTRGFAGAMCCIVTFVAFVGQVAGRAVICTPTNCRCVVTPYHPFMRPFCFLKRPGRAFPAICSSRGLNPAPKTHLHKYHTLRTRLRPFPMAYCSTQARLLRRRQYKTLLYTAW